MARSKQEPKQDSKPKVRRDKYYLVSWFYEKRSGIRKEQVIDSAVFRMKSPVEAIDKVAEHIGFEAHGRKKLVILGVSPTFSQMEYKR